MPNEVVKIRRSRVVYRVPGFHNFGARKDELEREALRQTMSDPEHPKKLGDALKGSANLLDAALRKANEAVEKNRKQNPAMPAFMDSAMAGMLKQIEETLKDAELDLSELEDKSPDADAEVVLPAARPATDLQLLEILLDDSQRWSDEVQAAVDKFLDDWPALRPKILRAVFEAYRDAYADIRALAGGEPYNKITLPDPTGPEAIEDLFYLDGIHLDEHNRVFALTGYCTWDDEHGLGVRIKNDKVVEVGYADVAYQCPDE
jgi:hypothetical protein